MAGGLTRYHFFSGKGGVGKTTCAAAWAVARARRGRRVLALSSDPAHSLGDALEVELGPEPRPVALPPAPADPLDADGGPDADGGALHAAELAAGPAWQRWLESHRDAVGRIAEEGTYLDREDVDRLLALPLPGADELLALLEAVRLARAAGAAEVVVDTAPTAHTLRLLESPETLRRFSRLLLAMQEKRHLVAEQLTGGRLRDGSDATLSTLEEDAAEAAALARDPERGRMTWVLLPEELSVEETLDALAALEAEGVPVSEAVVNRLTPPPPEPCDECEARRRAEARAVRRLHRERPGLRLIGVPEAWVAASGDAAEEGDLDAVAAALAGGQPPSEVGAFRLDDAGQGVPEEIRAGGADLPPAELPAGSGPGTASSTGPVSGAARPTSPAPPEPAPLSPSDLADLLAPAGLELLFFAGKGGVGKSTCAAAAALLLARHRPRRRILLLSTDPAHSLADVLEVPLGDEARPMPGGPANLSAREIDAGAVLERVRGRLRGDLEDLFGHLGRDGGWEAAADRRVLERFVESPPPGLDELVAVAALSAPRSAGGPGSPELVVVDTAPTGHALRLLEMPALALDWDHALMSILLKYRRTLGLGSAAEELLRLARDLRRLDERLRDPTRTRFALVTRAARLPHRETLRLAASLGNMGFAVAAVITNARTAGTCPRCRRRATAEARWSERLSTVLRQQAQRHRAGEGAADPDGAPHPGATAGSTGGAPAIAILGAPARFPPPTGLARLREWIGSWHREPPPPAAGATGSASPGSRGGDARDDTTGPSR